MSSFSIAFRYRDRRYSDEPLRYISQSVRTEYRANAKTRLFPDSVTCVTPARINRNDHQGKCKTDCLLHSGIGNGARTLSLHTTDCFTRGMIRRLQPSCRYGPDRFCRRYPPPLSFPWEASREQSPGPRPLSQGIRITHSHYRKIPFSHSQEDANKSHAIVRLSVMPFDASIILLNSLLFHSL